MPSRELHVATPPTRAVEEKGLCWVKKNGFKGFGGVKGGLPKKYGIDKQLMLNDMHTFYIISLLYVLR